MEMLKARAVDKLADDNVNVSDYQGAMAYYNIE
jgi:hypothetical protein